MPQLLRVQQAYERVLAVHRAEWEVSDPAERGPFEPDLAGCGIFEQEEDLLAVIDMPRVLPLLSQCLGEDLQIRQVQTRYNPGGGDPTSLGKGRDAISPGIGGWHRDRSNYHNNATGRSMWLKVFIYFYDVTEDGGPTALVPQVNFAFKYDEYCIKTVDFCIENDEFCRPTSATSTRVCCQTS